MSFPGRFLVETPARQFDSQSIIGQVFRHDAGDFDALLAKVFSQTPDIDRLPGPKVNSRPRILEVGARIHGTETADVFERLMKMIDASSLVTKMAQPQFQHSTDQKDAGRFRFSGCR